MDNFDKVLAVLDSLYTDTEDILFGAIDKAVKIVQGDAKKLTPVDSGRLRNSIVTNVDKVDNEIVGTVSSNLEYAPYVEFGTGPKGRQSPKIVPKEVTLVYRKNGWAYKNPKPKSKDDEWIYTTGQAAQPFMYPALNQNKTRVKDVIAKEVKNRLRG